MQKYPEPVVGAFVFNPQGQLFLMKSHKWKDLYVIPGGHIEVGETMEKALKREVKEETGLEIYDTKFLCVWEFIAEKGFHEQKHMLFLNFQTKTNSDKITLSREAHDYIWSDLRGILRLPLEKYTRLTIKDYLLGQ